MIGFPLWEEAVFKLLQPVFGELQAIFSNYAQSISGGSLQTTTLQAVTLQDNELVSFCRDAGLITEKLTNARVQSMMKDVANAFAATRTTGATADKGQGGGTGVYSAGIHMPAFLVLLLLIALNRANPKREPPTSYILHLTSHISHLTSYIALNRANPKREPLALRPSPHAVIERPWLPVIERPWLPLVARALSQRASSIHVVDAAPSSRVGQLAKWANLARPP